MTIVRYTLLADGSSDAALMPIIDWLINQHRPDLNVQGQFAEHLGDVGRTLPDRLSMALQRYPCELFFVHRDAENAPHLARLEEIVNAAGIQHPNLVPVIPGRMTEAWLLSDESAIRAAAGNRHGKTPLNLPPKRQWDSLPDPKAELVAALKAASEKTGRALSKFHPLQCRHLVAARTANFSDLRGIGAFDRFEQDLVNALREF
ncbi:MAG: hypothetical protein JO002_02130 [Burkholderiaceae bacterium]|nr:hypothetical protein [Burkholderiaceae bacterium]